MSTASKGPPNPSAAGRSRPLSGPTRMRSSSAQRIATARRAAPTSGSTTARWTPGGANGSDRARVSAPPRTSWRGTPWVRSMTRASGAIRAITAWQTPTKSSAQP